MLCLFRLLCLRGSKGLSVREKGKKELQEEEDCCTERTGGRRVRGEEGNYLLFCLSISQLEGECGKSS